jgi:hypothetical protein
MSYTLQPAEADEQCSDCGAKANLVVVYAGCKYCGGGDCGDTGDYVPYCADCAKKNGIHEVEVSPS